jgi:hypothetical protein
MTNDSFLSAGSQGEDGDSSGNIIVNNSMIINNSNLNANGNIGINNSIVNQSALIATKNIKINQSDLNGSMVVTDKNVNISNQSNLSDSMISTGKNITITSSTINNVKLHAKNNINITDSFASGYLKAKAKRGNIYISNTTGVTTTSEDDEISTLSLATATLKAGNNITIDNSTFGDTTANARNNITITDSQLGATEANATNGKLLINANKNGTGSTLASLTSNSQNIEIDNSTINGAADLTATGTSITDEILIENSTITGETTANAANDVTINYYSTLADTTINSGRNTNIIDSYLRNTTITEGGNIASIDSYLSSGTLNAVGNINLSGICVKNDLTITGANDLVISNSDSVSIEDYPTIAGLAGGMSTISDYNRARFSSSTFETEAKTLGYGAPAFGAGTRISFIGGNLGVSNVNSAAVVNTAILGNLTESSITTDASLVRSYVGGNYEPERTTIGKFSGGGASVYESFIKGHYNKYYPDSAALNDVNKLRYGSPLDTNFRQQFSPKGFAASDDEINILKRNFISNITKGKNNSIKLNNEFKAY